MRRMLCTQDPAGELEASCEGNKGLESSHDQDAPFGGHTLHWAFPGRPWPLSGQWCGKLWTRGRETGWVKMLSWRVQAVCYGVFSSLERISSSGYACQGAYVYPLLLAGPIRCVRAGPISPSLDVSLEGLTVQRHQDPRAELPNVPSLVQKMSHIQMFHTLCAQNFRLHLCHLIEGHHIFFCSFLIELIHVPCHLDLFSV